MNSIQTITSSQNPRFKQALRLQNNRGRRQQDRIIVFGLREVLRAINSRCLICELYVCSQILPTSQLDDLTSLANARQFPIFDLTVELFVKMQFGQRDEGVVCIVQRPNTDLEHFLPTATGLVLVVESLEKPGNLGALARSADGGGVAGMIHANPLTDFFHPNSIRSSVGTVFHLPLATAATADVIDWLKQHRYTVYLASLAGSVDYTTVDLGGTSAVVLGNEASGLSEYWYDHGFTAIRLPMQGIADSLNISVTAGILIYESLRQRQQNRD